MGVSTNAYLFMASYRKSYYLKHPRSAYREFIYWPIKNTWQRARRGWADSEVWGLDHALCLRLGAQLQHLAKTDHGWPDQKFKTPEEWTAALNANAEKLLNYANRPGHDKLLTTWHDLKFGKDDAGDWLEKLNSDDDSPETEAAWRQMHDLEDRWYAEAQEAMHWVADHLGHLWD